MLRSLMKQKQLRFEMFAKSADWKSSPGVADIFGQVVPQTSVGEKNLRKEGL